MKRLITTCLSALRLFPHILLLTFHDKKGIIKADLDRWAAVSLSGEKKSGYIVTFIKIMTFYPEYRNLFYKRTGSLGGLFKWLCKPISTLFINTDNIGPGLFIQHGFATIIAATKIGSNCWINQQVTIGYSAKDPASPILGNNVSIGAGAKVLGNVTVGDNSIVGANAVVVKNVPQNVTVVGVPAYIIRRNGVRVNEQL